MDGATPRYHQLKAMLREGIRAGAWRPGDLIPSERALSDRHGVSRMTARQSVTELVQEGMLYRKQGRGTFVAWPRIAQGLAALTSFTEEMEARGLRPGSRVLDQRVRPATDAEAVRLQLRPGTSVCAVRRLRLADDAPLAVECAVLGFPGCEHLGRADLAGGSLYALLAARFGVIPHAAEQEIAAGRGDAETASLLGIAPGDPVLLLRRTAFTDRDHPFEYAESVYRADAYTFHTRLVRAGTSVSG